MPKQQQQKFGGNKAKGRQSAKGKASGYYKQRFAITERNRRRKHRNHIRVHPNDLQAIKAMAKRGYLSTEQR